MLNMPGTVLRSAGNHPIHLYSDMRERSHHLYSKYWVHCWEGFFFLNLFRASSFREAAVKTQCVWSEEPSLILQLSWGTNKQVLIPSCCFVTWEEWEKTKQRRHGSPVEVNLITFWKDSRILLGNNHQRKRENETSWQVDIDIPFKNQMFELAHKNFEMTEFYWILTRKKIISKEISWEGTNNLPLAPMLQHSPLLHCEEEEFLDFCLPKMLHIRTLNVCSLWMSILLLCLKPHCLWRQ